MPVSESIPSPKAFDKAQLVQVLRYSGLLFFAFRNLDVYKYFYNIIAH
jgi:hypothetical protein